MWPFNHVHEKTETLQKENSSRDRDITKTTLIRCRDGYGNMLEVLTSKSLKFLICSCSLAISQMLNLLNFD